MADGLRVSIMLLLVTVSHCAVITGVCQQDAQCAPGTCCALLQWLPGLRVCMPLAREGEECSPGAQPPFFRRRPLSSCPCLPRLLCSRRLDGKHRCSQGWKDGGF